MQNAIDVEVDFGNDGYKIKAKLYKDGDQWCCGVGENIQVGTYGFGYSMQSAIHTFKSNFRNSK